MRMMSRLLAATALLALFPQLAQGQDDAAGSPVITAEEVIDNAATSWSILPTEAADPCAAIDENSDPDTIVVCREWESGERFMVDAPTRADTDVTGSGAPRAPDVSGLKPCSAYTVCMKFGSVPPPAIMVDFAALPETPAGSDAARLYGGPTDAAPATED